MIEEKIIYNVIEELKDIKEKVNINLYDSIIVNISELIKEEYSKDITEFKVLTSTVGLILTMNENVLRSTTRAIVFVDDKIKNLESVNLTELLGLVGVDLTKYKYLSKCNFLLNRLYLKDQINMIPGLIFENIYGEDSHPFAATLRTFETSLLPDETE